MADTVQTGQSRTPQLVRAASLVNAAQIAHDTEVRQSPNGVSFATFGETGLADLDLDRMLETVPTSITAALKANTYYFVPLALREAVADGTETPEPDAEALLKSEAAAEPTMVASAYTDEFSDVAICHRNVELGHGRRGVFISTRLMGDRFALSFEFFINVAHAFVDQAGTPQVFADLVWKQALGDVRGETSIDAWETRNLAFGRPANAQPDPTPLPSRRNRGLASFSARQRAFASDDASQPAVSQMNASAQADAPPSLNDKDRALYLEAAFSDAVAIYLLSLALDFDYSELREREYPLLSPAALAARLRIVAQLYPPNPGYEFAVKYRRRA
ncbi:MAG TPA: hypothetical protein VK814_03015 [Acidobacteriaceae bacterium]|jgi:hypothetical protein|nr:hypothetical protein [Acidobacteriaceae bacterium]